MTYIIISRYLGKCGGSISVLPFSARTRQAPLLGVKGGEYTGSQMYPVRYVSYPLTQVVIGCFKTLNYFHAWAHWAFDYIALYNW